MGQPYGDEVWASAATGELPDSVDVVVIGGGIVGVSSAWSLARRGVKVLLVEKKSIASEQSGRNWGFVRQQGRDPAELPLAMMANRIWRNLEGDLGRTVDWRQGGNVALADADEKVAAYEEWSGLAADSGLDTRLIGMEQVRDLVRGLRGDWRVAIYTPSDGHVNPLRATLAIAGAAESAGAQILTGCAAEAIEVSGGRVVGVRTALGHVRATSVVLAGGIWSSRLASTADVDLPQGIVTNSVSVTRPLPRLTDAGVWSRELAFRQLANGQLLVSAEIATEVDLYLNDVRRARLFMPMFWRNRATFSLNVSRLSSIKRRVGMRRWDLEEPLPNMRQLNVVYRHLRARLPDLGDITPVRAWAGHIDGTPDGLPIIESLSSPHGLVLATAFSGHGFALGPAVGSVVADLVVDGRTSVELNPMRLGRFSERTFGQPKSIL